MFVPTEEREARFDELSDFVSHKVEGAVKAGKAGDRRQFFRLPVVLPIELRTQYKGELSGEEKAMSLDISASGISFVFPRPLPLNKVIHIVISGLPFVKNPTIVALVARCQRETTQTGQVVYVIGADFRSYVSRQLRAQLMRAVTILQRVNENRKLQCC